MHATRITWRALVAVLLGLAATVAASARSGGAPARTSGGDFPGERSCTVCHQGELNSGAGMLELLIAGAPAAGQTYSPGETVVLTVDFSDPAAARIGFQLTARSGDGCGQPGELGPGESPAGALVKTGGGPCGAAGAQVQWATQRRPETGAEARFDIAWTAPQESVGPVTIAVAVNGANGDLGVQGDQVYSKQVVLQPMAAPSAPPVISEGGVILADRYSSTAVGAPSALAIVRGTDFAAPGASSWALVDEQGMIGTNLDGTCVEVNQERAPVLAAQADEVTFQIPAGVGLGPAMVQVIRGCGSDAQVVSAAAPFEVAAVQPVFFLWAEDPKVVALHQDWTLVAEADAVEGVVARPAVAGDLVTLLGTGFGPVHPPLRTGEVALEPREFLSDGLKLLIGEFELTAEQIAYAGAAPGFAGLFQLDLLIPEIIPAGSHSFSVMLDGEQSPEGPVISIAMADTEPPMCEVGAVIAPGGSCVASVFGIAAVLTVDMEGGACVNAAAVGLEICGADSLPLALYGADVTKNDDGSWTVNRLP